MRTMWRAAGVERAFAPPTGAIVLFDKSCAEAARAAKTATATARP